ncbi:hypothetical protein ERUR111494_02440 [Erysipelothrix urinaevulpis]|uniref:hypothetical protein n=1 Tax=Erysipelothrix urinaevulpis TaxID=2683717 RepID=UPI001358EF3E|nr:hypothetical protein [Erysipelothrix urinaevulpis]
MKQVKAGDYILYKMKNEIGVVKRVTERGCFAWFHTGDTAAHITPEHFETLDPHYVAFNHSKFANNYAYASLAKRRIDILLENSNLREKN